jgi:hypothetical protein
VVRLAQRLGAAKAIGVSYGTVVSAAHKLKIRFHGPRAPSKSGRPPVRRIKSAPKFASPTHVRFSGKAIAKLAGDPDANPHMRRRCPSCNRIFEPMEINHYLCDYCEHASAAQL